MACRIARRQVGGLRAQPPIPSSHAMVSARLGLDLRPAAIRAHARLASDIRHRRQRGADDSLPAALLSRRIDLRFRTCDRELPSTTGLIWGTKERLPLAPRPG